MLLHSGGTHLLIILLMMAMVLLSGGFFAHQRVCSEMVPSPKACGTHCTLIA